MSKRPRTPSEEPTEKLGEPGSETEAPSGEEDVTYEEVTAISPGVSIPEIPEIGPEDVDAGFPEGGVSSEEKKEVMQPTEVGDIPDIPEEKSWSEVVYEEGGMPQRFQV
jgi:hypothetical protein